MKKFMTLCMVVALIVTAAVGSGWAADGDSQYTGYGEFVVTGYTVDKSSITKGTEVSFSLHLKHTSQIRTENMTADISRLVDSFSGGQIYYAFTSEMNAPLEMDVSISGLKYNGTGRSLKLMVSTGGVYKQLEISVAECKEYEEPVYEPAVPEEPDPIPAPMAVMSRNELKRAIKAGETKTITVYVKNVGSTTMKSPIISFSPSDSLILPGTSSALQMKDIAPGKSESVDIQVQALDTISGASQYLDMELKFQYYNRLTTVEGSSSGRVTIPAEVKKVEEPEPEETVIDSPVPNLIITSFDYGGGSVAANAAFNLSFRFVNTSSSLPVENVVVTVEGGEGFTINGSANTFYFEKIKAGGTKSVNLPMKALPEIANGTQPVLVSFKYEYVDNKKRISSAADSKITVPVYQPDRFEITNPTVPVFAYAGEETSVTLNYVNKSKGPVSNVEASLEGDVETYTPVQNIGNLEAGKSGTIAFAVTAWEEGEAAFTVKVTYEDANGDTRIREFPLTMPVEAMVMDDPDYEEPAEETEVEPQTNWKLIAAVTAAGIVVLFMIIHRKRKAAALKKEAAMWDSWDDVDAGIEDFGGINNVSHDRDSTGGLDGEKHQEKIK